MSLLGALAKIQKNGVDMYLQMSQRFGENALIRSEWVEMARDLERQTASLKSLPGAFWNSLKADQITLNAAAELCSKKDTSCSDRSLHGCFATALDFEEPIILRTYVPLIKVLRTGSWTDRGLDFYILVKAHIARLTRFIEPFSGDPTTVQRAHNLLAQFEREVQQPSIPTASSQVKAAAKRPKRARHAEPSKPIHARVSRTKTATRPKRLVKKLSMPRRRAQG